MLCITNSFVLNQACLRLHKADTMQRRLISALLYLVEKCAMYTELEERGQKVPVYHAA